jgi:hypothetical protein
MNGLLDPVEIGEQVQPRAGPEFSPLQDRPRSHCGRHLLMGGGQDGVNHPEGVSVADQRGSVRSERNLFTRSSRVRISIEPQVRLANPYVPSCAVVSRCGIRNAPPRVFREGAHGSPGWIRTNDQVVNSHLLYR